MRILARSRHLTILGTALLVAVGLLLPVAAWAMHDEMTGAIAPSGTASLLAIAPDTLMSVSPTSPDGVNGWYVTRPRVYASSDQTGTLRYVWSDHRKGSIEVTPSALVDLGSAIDGSSTVRAYTRASGSVLEGRAASIALRVDTRRPSAPAAPQAWKNTKGWVRISWKGSVDRGSGLAGYHVQRSIAGAPSEKIGKVQAGTLYFEDHDAALASASDVSYSIVAFDRAGLESTSSALAEMGIDMNPPSTPTSVFARPTIESDLGWGWGRTLPSTDRAAFVVYAYSYYRSDSQATDIVNYHFEYGPDAASPAHSLESVLPYAKIDTTQGYADWFFRVYAQDRAGNRSAASKCVRARFVPVDRVSGKTRVATSLAVSAKAFTSSRYAVFAGSLSPADALTACSLAGALDAPVILAGPDGLGRATIAELERLGVKDAFVVGGGGAVTAATYRSIDRAVSGSIERLAGTDRFGTCVLVERKARGFRKTPAKRAYVVGGYDIRNLAVAAATAYSTGDALILSGGKGFSPQTLAALSDSQVKTLVMVGPAAGAGADRGAFSTKRITASRTLSTSQAFIDWTVSAGLLKMKRPVLSSAADFSDASAAAVLAGTRGCPNVQVSPRDPYSAASYLERHHKTVRGATIVGGVGAVDERARLMVWSILSSDGYFGYW